ncbi:MAG TPA: hypothetical protein VGD08_15105 [Stellaceae bacterium]|jgi:hypothetical protein
MIELVLVVCMMSSPASCQEERPAMGAELSLRTCAMQGQAYAAQWLSEHPKWLLSGWRCESSARREEPT